MKKLTLSNYQIEIAKALSERKAETGTTAYRIAKETKLSTATIDNAFYGKIGNIKTLMLIMNELGLELYIKQKD